MTDILLLLIIKLNTKLQTKQRKKSKLIFVDSFLIYRFKMNDHKITDNQPLSDGNIFLPAGKIPPKNPSDTKTTTASNVLLNPEILPQPTSLTDRVKLEPDGSKERPYKLPDAKKNNAKFFTEIHADLLTLMDKGVIASIKAIPSIHNTLVWDDTEQGYRLSEEKLKQRPYDEFHKDLTRKYGQDPLFKGGPKELTAQLKQKLDLNKEYIFGVVREKAFDGTENIKILVLPRDEIIKLDNGKFFTSRHTHSEFLLNDSKSVAAAGTLVPEATRLRYNFRTGHFNIHQDDAAKLAKLRSKIQELFQWASDKTLPNSKPTTEQLSKLALEYKGEHQASHNVMDEISSNSGSA